VTSELERVEGEAALFFAGIGEIWRAGKKMSNDASNRRECRERYDGLGAGTLSCCARA
jgi:hypothetical protein